MATRIPNRARWLLAIMFACMLGLFLFADYWDGFWVGVSLVASLAAEIIKERKEKRQ